MKIHKEGYQILTGWTIILLAINGFLFFIVGKSIFTYFILAISIVLFLIVLNFFRSPNRIFQRNEKENVIVSPADGTIVVIEEVIETEHFNEKRMQVSIFMNLFNAHINWIPVDGKIIYHKHHSGRFMSAYLPKSSSENERSVVIIETASGEKILVKQIAGAIARRIVTYAKPGNSCRINEQLGFIKFGSRVDILLPLDSEILIEMDQKILGNKTVIAKLKE